jgi:hypothetical protein
MTDSATRLMLFETHSSLSVEAAFDGVGHYDYMKAYFPTDKSEPQGEG